MEIDLITRDTNYPHQPLYSTLLTLQITELSC